MPSKLPAHSSSTSSPVIATIGSSLSPSSSLILLVDSIPPMTGILRSISTRSARLLSSFKRSSPFNPLSASSQSNPSFSIILVASLAQTFESSTIKQRGVEPVGDTVAAPEPFRRAGGGAIVPAGSVVVFPTALKALEPSDRKEPLGDGVPSGEIELGGAGNCDGAAGASAAALLAAPPLPLPAFMLSPAVAAVVAALEPSSSTRSSSCWIKRLVAGLTHRPWKPRSFTCSKVNEASASNATKGSRLKRESSRTRRAHSTPSMTGMYSSMSTTS
mmetsp:Transcript_27161/g.63474  ORF Transcript_27161/g.63474 Transcript_27161/m.63474 type:complete len:274 (-) Transcript_27161:2576-3397(-)